MKVLIIRSYPSYMDVEKNTYNIQEVGLAKALVRKGNICDIVFWTDKEEKEVIIPVEHNGVVKVFYRHGKTALKNTVFTNCQKLFEQYDVLQTAEYNQIQSWILAKQYPNKMIIYHGPYYSPFNKRYNLMCYVFDRFFLRRYLEMGTDFITKSNLAQDFLENKGINASHIRTVGVGIDTQMLSSGDVECKEPLFLKMKDDKSLKILYIGRFEERRNIPFIFECVSAVLQRNVNATLYMIGTGNKEYVEGCWSYANELGIRENIVYQERVEQKYLSGIYNLADFFLLPTEYEIFGMVLLEAMYYKTVVLTTNNGGSSTLIENDKNGYIIESMKAQVWADKISEITHEQMDMIKEASHNTIANRYTWDELADLFLECYKRIGNRKKVEKLSS